MFNARMRFSKTGNAKFISHLDTMHLFQRTFQRAELPLRYTEGFNPHPYVSVLLPLPTGFSGLDEIIDFDLNTDCLPDDALSRVNGALPAGFCAHEIGQAVTKPKEIAYAGYRIGLFCEDYDQYDLPSGINALFGREEIRIRKRSKGGETEVNIKDYMADLRAFSENGAVLIDAVLSAGNKSLNPEYIAKAIEKELPLKSPLDALYVRTSILNGELKIFR